MNRIRFDPAETGPEGYFLCEECGLHYSIDERATHKNYCPGELTYVIGPNIDMRNVPFSLIPNVRTLRRVRFEDMMEGLIGGNPT